MAKGIALVRLIVAVVLLGPWAVAVADGTVRPVRDQGALDGATVTPGGSKPVPLQDRFRLAVVDYCSPGTLDGKTDNTGCVQAAVRAFCGLAHGGGVLQLPAGSIAISAAVGITIPCQGVTVAGVGWGNRDDATAGTKIVVTGAGSAPIFNFSGTSRDVDKRYAIGGGVRDLMFIAHNPAGEVEQTGPMIALDHCSECVVDRVYSWNAYRFATVFAGFGTRLSNLRVTQLAVGGEGIKLFGSDAGCGGNIGNCPGRLDLVTIDHTVLDAALAAGYDTAGCLRASNFVATVMISNVTCGQTLIALNVDCPDSASIAACPQFITAFDLESEPNGRNNSAHAAGIAASDVVHLHCSGCQFFGYDVDNLVNLRSARFAGASDVQLMGGRYQSARLDCIVSSVGALQVVGAKILDCNQANAGGAGIQLRPNLGGAAYSGSNTIMGNQFCYEAVFGNTPPAMGGVLLTPGTDYNVVQGNNFRGCKTGYRDLSGGSHSSFAGNVGP